MLEFGVVILIFQNELCLQNSKQIEIPLFHMSLFCQLGTNKQKKSIILKSVYPCQKQIMCLIIDLRGECTSGILIPNIGLSPNDIFKQLISHFKELGVIWTSTLCLSVGSCIMLLAAVFCFFIIISFLSQKANSKAILDQVFIKNLWPSEQHQWGLSPVVWRFSWGNQQCAVFKDQGQWNSIEIPFIRCGILRLFLESYWEGTTFWTLFSRFHWQQTVLV